MGTGCCVGRGPPFEWRVRAPAVSMHPLATRTREHAIIGYGMSSESQSRPNFKSQAVGIAPFPLIAARQVSPVVPWFYAVVVGEAMPRERRGWGFDCEPHVVLARFDDNQIGFCCDFDDPSPGPSAICTRTRSNGAAPTGSAVWSAMRAAPSGPQRAEAAV
jgi:hypothetical protein